MYRPLEIVLGFLFGADLGGAAPGAERSIEFNPPSWMGPNPQVVNLLFIAAAAVLVVWVYRRDGRRPGARIGLGILRGLLFAYLITLINRPVLKVVQTHTEPSVVAILIDDSYSMYLRDTKGTEYLADRIGPSSRPVAPSSMPAVAAAGAGTQPAETAEDTSVEYIGGTGPTRLDVAVGLLTGDQQSLIRKLAAKHSLRFYHFSRDATALGGTTDVEPKDGPNAGAPKQAVDPKLVDALHRLEPSGGSTQLIPSLLTVLGDLQGQQVDGVVIITDARETPAASPPAQFDQLKRYDVKFFPIAVGTEKPLRNLSVTSLSVQDSAFTGDIVTAKVSVRATGYEPNKTVHVHLKDKKSGVILRNVDGKPAEAVVTLPDDRPQEVELVFQAKVVGTLEVVANVDVEDGELDPRDNQAQETVAVLDSKVNVLYVEGYPRWEYRYIKNEMIREKSVNISCLLTSADSNFRQEGDPPEPNFDKPDENGKVIFHDPRTGSKFPGPIARFPETMDELRKFDVVLFGDVDPRQFSNRQIKMISDFVEKEAGGFGMIAGPQHAPYQYKNTPIDALLPVKIDGVGVDDPTALYRDGWRPVITDEGRRGEASMMFRFFADKEKNDKYLRDDLQPVFWYCNGISVKEGVGLVYAEHPFHSDPNTGRKAPILVLGQFGTGRTLFSAIDDSWRWRYYTGESVFDTYWVQQMRYLSRGRKLAERGFKFTTDRDRYERGQTVRLNLTILSPKLLKDRAEVKVKILDDAKRVVHEETLLRQDPASGLFTTSFVANDASGAYHIVLPPLADGLDPREQSYHVIIPRLELERPQVDRNALRKLAPENHILVPQDAREQLPKLITGEGKKIAVSNSTPLWDRAWLLQLGSFELPIPRAVIIFMLLLTSEWVLRKVFGML